MTAYTTKDKKITFDSDELPFQECSMSIEGNVIDDTNFLTNNGFKTSLVGLQMWSVEGSGHISGNAGYLTTIKKSGSTTAFTDEATTLVSGKTYRINNTAKRVWDEGVAVVVKDNNVDHTADVVSINYLFGEVTFAGGYSVTGAVTVTGSYLPMTTVAQAQAWDLSLEADVLDATDYETAAGNGGTRVHKVGLSSFNLTVERWEDISHDYEDLLTARTPLVVEVVTANGNLSFRGWYQISTANKAGNVTDLESESIELVGYGRLNQNFNYAVVTAGIVDGIENLLASFFARTAATLQYLPSGTTGLSGLAFVSSLGFSGDVQGVDEFSASLVSGGGLSEV